jgi:hypothetical protein
VARKEIVVDDLDGSEGAQEVQIGLNGEWRKLDLSDKNYEALMKAIGKFWEKAVPPGSSTTRTSAGKGRRRGSTKPTGRKPAREYDREMMKEWAGEKGITLGKGRASYALVDEFEADVANGWQPQVA